MITRAGIVGLGTGGLLLAVLFYPLYQTLPGLYVQDWPTGSAAVSAIAVAAAVTLTILCGWLAACWGGAHGSVQRVGLGALAGGLAALLVFCGLGAAAAGTLGSGAVLQSGAVSLQSGAVGQTLLLDAINRTALCTQWMFWGMLLIGVLLGALGGWRFSPRPALAGRALYNKTHPQMALNVSIAAAPATALAVLLTAGLFRGASQVIQHMTGASSSALASASLNLVNGPVTTALLLYLAAQAALALVTPHEARQAEHRCGVDEVKMAAYVGIATPLLLGAGLLVAAPSLLLRPVTIGSWLLSLAMSARQVRVLRTLILPRRGELPAPPDGRQALFFGSIARSRQRNLFLLCVGCGLAFVFPLHVAVVSTALNLWLIPVQRLILGASEPAAWSVQRLYRIQVLVSLGSMAGAAAVLTGLYLFYAALGRWFQRRVQNGTLGSRGL